MVDTIIRMGDNLIKASEIERYFYNKQTFDIGDYLKLYPFIPKCKNECQTEYNKCQEEIEGKIYLLNDEYNKLKKEINNKKMPLSIIIFVIVFFIAYSLFKEINNILVLFIFVAIVILTSYILDMIMFLVYGKKLNNSKKKLMDAKSKEEKECMEKYRRCKGEYEQCITKEKQNKYKEFLSNNFNEIEGDVGVEYKLTIIKKDGEEIEVWYNTKNDVENAIQFLDSKMEEYYNLKNEYHIKTSHKSVKKVFVNKTYRRR